MVRQLPVFTLILVLLASSVAADGAPNDITITELQAKGVPPSLRASIMSLPAERRISLKADVTAINSAIKKKGYAWTAGYNKVSILSDAEKGNLLGDLSPRASAKTMRKKKVGPVRAIPASFDLRASNGVTSVKDQFNCGSCWAFAGVAALEGALKYKGKGNLDLSEQDLVSCLHGTGCSGATRPFQEDMFKNYFTNTGVPDEACFPYQERNEPCSQRCVDSANRVVKSDGYKNIALNVNAIKSAIKDYGPVKVSMDVYYDFYFYNSGVYRVSSSNYQGGHAVVLVGWGSENGVDYWIGKNSWGTGWGENGYFKIGLYESAVISKQALAVVVNSPSPGGNCVDSDGGGNYRTTGYAEAGSKRKDDKCIGGKKAKVKKKLKEAICKPNKKGKVRPSYLKHTCASKCVNGACA
ncbi:MAG: C1 family peptidase [Candidatus Altiarchaeota archaeon]